MDAHPCRPTVYDPTGRPASALAVETMAHYGLEQTRPGFDSAGTWLYGSRTSAAVALATTERCVVELRWFTKAGGRIASLAPSRAACGWTLPAQTPEAADGAGDHRYLHLFQLTDLEPEREYTLDAVVRWPAAHGETGSVLPEPERACQAAADRLKVVVRTAALPRAIELPGALEGPPYVLDEPGAHYLLTRPFAAPGTAFRVNADRVTLDLNGYEVRYDEDPNQPDGDAVEPEGSGPAENAAGAGATAGGGASGPDPGGKAAAPQVRTGADRWRRGAYGVELATGLEGVRILNGRFRQGAGGHRGATSTAGFNVLIAEDCRRLEIAGIGARYHGPQLSGFLCRDSGPGTHVHHNAIADLGRIIDNRHRMCCALRLGSTGGGEVDHNLVVRTRQSALGSTGYRVHVHHNELHLDSHSINAFGIAVKDHSRVHDNRIFGCGDNVVGLATTGGCRHAELFRNYVWLQAHSLAAHLPHLNTREMESAGYSIMSGLRITWGCTRVDYHHNTILVTAREGGFVRGTFFYNDPGVHACCCRDSLIIALAEDELSHGWGAVGGVGTETRGPVEPFLFAGNTIVSNFACVNLQDPYGVAVNYRFVGNTFVRVGRRPDFATVRARQVRPSRGHVFRDNRFLQGADLEHVLLGPEDEFEVQWTCELRVPPGAAVTVTSASGEHVFQESAEADGRLRLVLPWYRRRGEQRTWSTPYCLRVTGPQGDVRQLEIARPLPRCDVR